MLPRHSAVTLEQVAREAGVSRATVSRIVNGVSTVDPAIAERVQVVVDRLGYVPNLSARSLASRRSGAVALVVPEDVERFFGDPFFGALVAGIHEGMRGSGYLLEVLIAADDPRQTSSVLLGGKVDAAILFSHRIEKSFMKTMSAALPVVLAGRPSEEQDDGAPHHVDVDNRGGAAAVTGHLLQRGHRRIAMIRGPRDSPAAEDRLQGYLDAHREAGLEIGPIADGDFTAAGGATAAEELLGQDGWTALFAASDLMAMGALSVLESHGIRVPDDVAVAGFDDVAGAAKTVPPLTTVRQPSRDQGAALAETALALIAGGSVERRTVLPTELVVRSSS